MDIINEALKWSVIDNLIIFDKKALPGILTIDLFALLYYHLKDIRKDELLTVYCPYELWSTFLITELDIDLEKKINKFAQQKLFNINVKWIENQTQKFKDMGGTLALNDQYIVIGVGQKKQTILGCC